MSEKTGSEGLALQSEPVPKSDKPITFNLSGAFENRLEPVLEEIDREYQQSSALARIPRELREDPPEKLD